MLVCLFVFLFEKERGKRKAEYPEAEQTANNKFNARVLLELGFERDHLSGS